MCRECFREYNRRRYERDGDAIRAQVAVYTAANAEKVRAAKYATYWRDVEVSRARARKSATIQNAKPERKAAKLEWARANRAANPEKWRAKWRAQSPESAFARDSRRRARKRAQSIAPTPAALLRLKWSYWGGRCWMCGLAACEWDHVKPISRGGSHCLANLRPACRKCNATKRNTWPWPQKEC